MATETSSIDDMLMSAKTQTQPAAPENQYENNLEMVDEGSDAAEEVSYEAQSYEPKHEKEEIEEEAEAEEPEDMQDEYGNSKAKPRTYTEDEVNERINKAVRERMARFDRNNATTQSPAQQQQVQQKVSQNFEYDPDASGNWEQQLENLVEQTFNKINQRQVTQAQQQREARAHEEFQDKFTQGMDKFNDFKDIVGSQPITDPMTMALRGLKDPASFIYAASKRHPQELQRISQIPDGVSQMVEMGRLEERMRKNASSTTAPRPISRTREDTGMPVKEKKSTEPSIEDMIAKADAKRRAQLVQKRGR